MVVEGAQRTARGRAGLLWRYASWHTVVCALTNCTILLAEACRKITEQIEYLEQMFPAGLYTTVGRVSSMDTIRITLCLSSIASSNGLKGF